MSEHKATTKQPMRVVVMGASRCGTMGIYTALKTLGYKAFHMYEVVIVHGERQLPQIAAGIDAEIQGRVPALDLDHLLQGYDAFVEIGSYFPLTTLERYLPDENIKWILSERDPENWARSLDGTIGYVYRQCSTVPSRVLGIFDPWLSIQHRWLGAWFERWGGRRPGDPKLLEAMQSSYLEYNELIKSKVPADRLLTIKLEDGVGWSDICEFLDHPVPNEPYPRVNDRAEFKMIYDGLIKAHKMQATKRMMAVLVPIVGVGAYALSCFIKQS